MRDSLDTYLGAEVAAEVVRCGEQRGWTARVPALPWRATDGYTDARLVTLVLEAHDHAEKIVLKVSARASVYPMENPAIPDDFRPHLVLASQPSWSTRSGGTLTFQKVAGDDVTGCRSLAAVPFEQVPGACAVVVDRILRRWNAPLLRPQQWPIWQLLRSEVGPELASAGSIRAWAEAAQAPVVGETWVTVSGDEQVYPNPIALMREDSPLAGRTVDVLVGHRHGDLHLLNVLLPVVPYGTPQFDRFQLIDLDGYADNGPLSSDAAMLLLSALAQELPNLPPSRWDDVLRVVVDSAVPAPPGPIFDVIARIHAAALAAIGCHDEGWSGDWRRQFQLSILATAVYFTTFTNLGPKRRWWFFRLAARLGLAVLRQEGVAVPDRGCLIRNSFRGVSDVPIEPEPSPPQPTRLDAVNRLVALAWRRSPADRDAARALLHKAYDEVRQNGTSAATVRDQVRDLLADTEQILGGDDPTTLLFLHELADWTQRSGGAQQAWELFGQATRRRARLLGSRHPDTLASQARARARALIEAAQDQRSKPG